MKFTPRSMARCRVLRDVASSTSPHEPPIAQAPKETSETLKPVRPSARYFMLLFVQIFDVNREPLDFGVIDGPKRIVGIIPQRFSGLRPLLHRFHGSIHLFFSLPIGRRNRLVGGQVVLPQHPARHLEAAL